MVAADKPIVFGARYSIYVRAVRLALEGELLLNREARLVGWWNRMSKRELLRAPECRLRIPMTADERTRLVPPVALLPLCRTTRRSLHQASFPHRK
jgi:hypothetical protein